MYETDKYADPVNYGHTKSAITVQERTVSSRRMRTS